MNKLFTKIAALALGMTMATGVGVAVATSSKEVAPVQATDTKVSFTTGSNTVAIKVNWNSAGAPSSNNGVRMGTSSNAGSATFSIPSGTTKFGFYAVGWNNKATTASVSASVGTISTSTASLTSNSAATGTINADATVSITETEANAKKEFTISNVTSASTITLTTSGSNKRLIAWDAYYVSAEKTLSSIAVKTAPTKTTYYAGDYFDPTGLELTATYSDSSTETISYAAHSADFTFTPSTSTALTQSHTSVTIAYGGKSTTQAITVNPARTLSSISVATAPTKTTYSDGENFDPTGLVINRTFSDSSSDTYTYANHTSEFTFSPSTSTPLTTSDTSVTITYGGKSTTQAITVNEATKFQLIKSTNDLVAGSEYLIGGSGENNGYFISTTQNSNNRAATSGTVSDEKVTLTNDMQVITLGGESGAWELIVNDTPSYLYTGSTTANRLQTTTTLNNNARWEITVANTGLATIHNVGNTSRGQMNYNYNSGSPMFSCYASGGDLCIYKLIDTAESIQINKNSVSGFKGDADNTVSITANNFTPTNIEVSYSTANIATVTKGTISGNIIPLNVSYDGVGSTTATITVKGGSQDYTVDLDISVAAKPASMTIVHGDIHQGVLEIETGEYKQVSFSGLDTDGNPYSISASDVTGTVESGSSVSLSGSRITGSSVGESVVRYTLNALTSIYAEVTVDVLDDYLESVNTVSFATGLTDTQGDSPTTEIFTSRTGTTHFGKTENIPLEDFTFSYTDVMGEPASQFSYDFEHGTTVDATHKLQTIYVYCTLGNVSVGSYTVTVEQKNDPLTAITFTNVVDNELDLARGNSFQLEWAYTPTNPTDGKEVVFRIDTNDDDIDITVSTLGLVSIGSTSNLGTALVVIESAHDETIYDFVAVSAILESMKYVVSEPETWTKVTDDTTLAAGDVLLLAESTNGYVNTDISSQIMGVTASTFSGSTVVPGTGAVELTLGGTSGSWTLANSSGELLGATAVKKLAWDNGTTTWSISITDGSATIQNSTESYGRFLYNHNNGNPRFTTYTSSTSSSMILPELYRKSGGDTEYTVDETLFNGVHDNFGEDKTYEWSETCSSFNTGNWSSAGTALTGISGFANYKLNRAVANASGNEIEQFLAKYDFIIMKFGTNYDFLDRFAQNGINYGAARATPTSILGENANTVAIVVIVSVISISAIGGYFFLRKKREN